MDVTVRLYEIETGKPIVVLNEEDMKDLGVHIGDRIRICKGEKCYVTAIIDATTSMVNEGEIGIFEEVKKSLDLNAGDVVGIQATSRPKSIEFIKKKLHGQHLHGHEITTIVEDIVENNLSDIELTALMVGAYINGYDMDETVALTQAIVETGDQIDFGEEVVDKHCIGGVAGNRTTMLVVPIIAAAGLTMPKTSSRAITSPAGTADTMEVLAKVEFKIDELKDIVNRVGACIVWGGSVNLAPADDKIIRVEYPLSIDPEGQVLASVMAKKKSVGSDYLVIDIPVGHGAKLDDMNEANSLARKFIELGNRLDIKTKCLVTDGSSPIGRGIGPALEARDVMMALDGRGPLDLVNKSIDLAAALLELSGKVRKGNGRALAEEILNSGKARDKMMEIIEAQGGDPKISPEDIPLGDKKYEITSGVTGRVRSIDSKRISKVARAAGAPKDHGAGIDLQVGVGDTVDKGGVLYTIYSSSENKLEDAIKLAHEAQPIRVGGVILEELV
ncbi:MAG: AMP phosphorylase [Candidatus Altiarchaeales archaeon]|nr:AMP phosphorylase [Candidatus Altiarchaeales archaeon]MBD3415958.1 AMP phosphorylase [Candidatus Altiarchaeales archaeon]